MKFTEEIKLRLLELYGADKEKLEPSSHDAKANKIQNNLWQNLTDTLNREYPSLNSTTQQIKTCFKNIKSQGKIENASRSK